MQHMFVNVMMVLQIGAIIQYGLTGNYPLMAYWTACLTINYVVTYAL
jgi:hypothetical protein